MLKKGKYNSSFFIWIQPNLTGLFPIIRPNPPTEFHENNFCAFCVILRTDKMKPTGLGYSSQRKFFFPFHFSVETKSVVHNNTLLH